MKHRQKGLFDISKIIYSCPFIHLISPLNICSCVSFGVQMVIILIFLSLLLTVLLRFRFINNSLFFRVLRRPFPAGFILFLLSSIIHLMIQKYYSPFSGNIYSVIIRSGISVITLWFFYSFSHRPCSERLLRVFILPLYIQPENRYTSTIYYQTICQSILKNQRR